MAQKVVVSLVDDLDGGEAEETVAFALDGKAYEIDLSATNAEKLRSGIAQFVEAARRPGGPRRPRRGSGGASTSASTSGAEREQNQAIRQWAREQGLKVSDRGRIPAEVLQAYHQQS
jgi:hypothetical protein